MGLGSKTSVETGLVSEVKPGWESKAEAGTNLKLGLAPKTSVGTGLVSEVKPGWESKAEAETNLKMGLGSKTSVGMGLVSEVNRDGNRKRYGIEMAPIDINEKEVVPEAGKATRYTVVGVKAAPPVIAGRRARRGRRRPPALQGAADGWPVNLGTHQRQIVAQINMECYEGARLVSHLTSGPTESEAFMVVMRIRSFRVYFAAVFGTSPPPRVTSYRAAPLSQPVKLLIDAVESNYESPYFTKTL
ncbi:hypothetical protein EVAR_98225_1 [Eumeta japonica]|uniref:Uncharacterized protein n=1 Tax=Eumeta variegata TaxID=151549 RepID=A0A4C1Y8A1_EUMVA|nr:hypothetical protein EVAR_98225_1 [Eumeta japonica]